jgi:inosine-uridine nucleoside N-ribohydrolase
MSSILKVDQIQLSNGNTPTIGDLGLNDTGMIVQHVRKTIANNGTTTSNNTFTDVANWNINITPKSSSNILLIRTTISAQVSGAATYYARYRFFNTTDNAVFHDNTHVAASHYNVSSGFWDEVPIMAMTNGACGFNTQKTIQLQVRNSSASGTWTNAWSSSDNRVLEIIEIAG